MFALALGTVVIAGSAPRDAATQATVGGAAWLALIFSGTAVLIALGLRSPPSSARDQEVARHLDPGELPQHGPRFDHTSRAGQVRLAGGHDTPALRATTMETPTR
ncbi:hypothetical protein [Streptomyces sp. enrichment culture]|uniref:hypothetical protein n=1 Tax=Streptomyces sp. enrichment culture TaxID=1795815 RepID=UPI003F5428E4